jgi:putative transposase
MVELVRSGRTPEDLAREFEPTAQSIAHWVRQAERDAGQRRDGGLRGVSRRRFPTTTRREPTHRPANDLVGRVFTAPAPNLLWVADIIYVPTAAGFLFLAVVLDAWSRRIVGWAIGYQALIEVVHKRLGRSNINCREVAPPEGYVALV